MRSTSRSSGRGRRSCGPRTRPASRRWAGGWSNGWRSRCGKARSARAGTIPTQAYERRATSFLRAALGGRLPAAVAAFVARIDQAAVANGLGQLLLKLTSPGVPDIYQGTELRDFSLVDPDNRRPVDFGCLTQSCRTAANGCAEARHPSPDSRVPHGSTGAVRARRVSPLARGRTARGPRPGIRPGTRWADRAHGDHAPPGPGIVGCTCSCPAGRALERHVHTLAACLAWRLLAQPVGHGADRGRGRRVAARAAPWRIACGLCGGRTA